MNQKIFITGTMRTGQSQIINFLSSHSKILILNDRVHFSDLYMTDITHLTKKI